MGSTSETVKSAMHVSNQLTFFWDKGDEREGVELSVADQMILGEILVAYELSRLFGRRGRFEKPSECVEAGLL